MEKKVSETLETLESSLGKPFAFHTMTFVCTGGGRGVAWGHLVARDGYQPVAVLHAILLHTFL